MYTPSRATTQALVATTAVKRMFVAEALISMGSFSFHSSPTKSGSDDEAAHKANHAKPSGEYSKARLLLAVHSLLTK